MAKLLIFSIFSLFCLVKGQNYAFNVEFSARDLKNADVLPPSQSDPFIELWIQRPLQEKVLFAETGVIQDNNNPNFPEIFRLHHRAGDDVTVTLDIYDDDGALAPQLIGSASFSLESLVDTPNAVHPIVGADQGTITVRSSIVQGSRHFNFKFNKMPENLAKDLLVH